MNINLFVHFDIISKIGKAEKASGIELDYLGLIRSTNKFNVGIKIQEID